ncbi:2Fe-2S iron-sulfur cluster-binding protein [Pseudomonas sp. AP-1]|uniref:2Fe-2S iron-sulfur cluster-binding protein n=1 Tax=Pseudomonas sp. AP-1 TaxID=3231718 RepID=UPI0035B2B9E5
MKRAHTLNVAQITPQGTEAVLIEFHLQSEDLQKFQFKPGQYLTLGVEVDGAAHWRCYSITSRPVDLPNVSVLVKRVVNGRVSNWICDNVKAGSAIEVLPPAGQFMLREPGKPVVMFAGGSGIAPIYSLARQALELSDSNVVLFYANRDRASTMLKDELEALANSTRGRLDVRYWYDAESGYPTHELLAEYVSSSADNDVYLCGPEGFMRAVEGGLDHAGCSLAKLYKEEFGAALDDNEDTQDDGVERTLAVSIKGERHTLPIKASETLLSAMLNAGLNVPHACKVGECASCICRVEQGNVKQMENSVLDEDDVAEGLALACQSRVLSDLVHIRFS